MRKKLPGSLYATRGRIAIKMRLPFSKPPRYVVRYTGLVDTPSNRRLALRQQQALYEELYVRQSDPTKSYVLSDVFEKYLQSKRISDKTRRGYQHAFKSVFGTEPIFCYAAPIQERLSQFAFVLAEKSKLSPITINTYLNYVQIFLNFCHEEGYLPRKINALKKFKAKAPAPTHELFSATELELLFAANYDKVFIDFCRFMYLTGARPIDALTLERKHIGKGVIHWRNKVSKETETLPVTHEVMQLLQGLPVNKNGKVFPWKYSSASRLSRRLAVLCSIAGVHKRERSLKTFRKNFKQSLRGLPFEVQMKLMRHKSPDVTLTNYEVLSMEEIGRYLSETKKPVAGV